MLDEQREAVATVSTPKNGAVEKGDDDVKLRLSGQVNRGVLFYDDGEKQDLAHVDNDHSSTRLRFEARGKYDEDVSAGANIEVQFESNSTADVSQIDERNVGDDNFTQRKLEIFVDSKTFGRVTFGQGDTASNSIAEIDNSGTSVVGYSSVSDFAGGLLFREDGGDLSDIAVGDAFSNFDGLSRDDRLRYDTPKFYGFTASASAVADERWDAALRYGDTIDDFKIGAGVAYAARQDDIGRVSGSASVLHVPTGLSLTGAAGSDDTDGDSDPVFYYGKVGFQQNFFDFGVTALSADYYYGDEIDSVEQESHAFGLQAVQKVDRIGTEFYVGYRLYQLDGDDESFEDISAALAGARVKF